MAVIPVDPERLRQAWKRQEARFPSWHALAAAVGTSHVRLGKIRDGRGGKARRVQHEFATRLAKALRVPLAWLSGGSDALPYLPLNTEGVIDTDGTGSAAPFKSGPTQPLIRASSTALALNELLDDVHRKAAKDFPPATATAVVAAIANLALDTAGVLYDARRALSAPPEWVDGIAALLRPWLEGRAKLSTVGLAGLTPTFLLPNMRAQLLSPRAAAR